MNADLAARRLAGADAYSELPTPTPSLEHWKYVEIGFDPDVLAPPAQPGAPLDPDVFLDALAERSATVTVIDGHVVSIETDDAARIVRFAEVAEGDHAFAAALAAGMTPRRDRLAAASLAHATDGALIHVAKGVDVAEPIVIDLQAVTPEVVSYAHLAVRIDDLARAQVVVVLRSADGFRAVVPRLDVSVGDGANLDLITVQVWGDDTRSTMVEQFVLGRDARLRVGEAGLDGAFARIDMQVDLAGDGSSVEVDGLSFGRDAQTLDYRVAMHHIGRSTSSNVFLKGAVDDDASSVFTGLLRIEEGAVRTSAFETNRNLVLSGNASAQSVPNLEILCDDVVCGHGSTVGQIEEEHLYYLMSRGLPQDHAERLLVHGFFEEIIEQIPVSALHEPLREAVRAKYGRTA